MKPVVVVIYDARNPPDGLNAVPTQETTHFRVLKKWIVFAVEDFLHFLPQGRNPVRVMLIELKRQLDKIAGLSLGPNRDHL